MTASREEDKMPVEVLVQIILQQWKRGKHLIAPTKIKLLLAINRSGHLTRDNEN